MIRTLVVEDDAVANAAHVSYVGRVAGFTVAGSAASGASKKILYRSPHCVVGT